jgi:hypothetical protein
MKTKIKNFGALNIEPENIPRLLDVTGKEAENLTQLIITPGNELYDAYQKGLAIGDHNKESALEKSAEKADSFALESQHHYRQRKKIARMKHNFFGI